MDTIRNLFWIFFTTNLLSSCASSSLRIAETGEEYLKLTTRQYSSATKEQVIKAAEQILKTAKTEDGEDYKFEYATENNLSSEVIIGHLKWNDKWAANAKGIDQWKIKASKIDNIIHVSVELFRDFSAPSGQYHLPKERKGIFIYSPPFHLFWARMDFLLNKREDWMTCTVFNKQFNEMIQNRIFNPLCYTKNSWLDYLQ